MFLLYLGCNVDGSKGDGTEQGTCSNGYLCNSDGGCYLRKFYEHVLSFKFDVNFKDTFQKHMFTNISITFDLKACMIDADCDDDQLCTTSNKCGRYIL